MIDEYNFIEIKDKTGKIFKFERVRELYSFLSSERNWWTEKHKELIKNKKTPITIFDVHSRFNGLMAELSVFYKSGVDYIIFNNKDLYKMLFKHVGWLNEFWLWSGHLTSEMVFKINLEFNNGVAEGFLKSVLLPIDNKYQLLGSLMSLESSFDSSPIKYPRRETIESLEQYEKDILMLISSFQSSADDTFNETSRKFSDFMFSAEEQLKEVEIKFKEKLRLEGPCKYWDDAASKYKRHAKFSIFSIVILSFLAIGYLTFLLNIELSATDSVVSLSTLHGLIIFVSIITIFALLFKVASKITFSSFHLMRDAEERVQLIHLYLSLIENSELPVNARDIVLQALFSRTDTGLLSTDSSPTMPGFGELIAVATKAK